MRWAVVALLLQSQRHAALMVGSHGLGIAASSRRFSTRTSATDGADAYASYWDALLVQEYREVEAELSSRRRTWSPRRLEASGDVFFGTATPETDLFGDKVVRVTRRGGGDARVGDKFRRGDVLVLSGEERSRRSEGYVEPRECVVVDAGGDWIAVGVGERWPAGVWEARRRPGTLGMRLDRVAPRGPLDAQRAAVAAAAAGAGGAAAALLAGSAAADGALAAAADGAPSRFVGGAFVGGARAPSLEAAARGAIARARAAARAGFEPNASQEAAIARALARAAALIRGPPGTGKTRAASLLVAAALELGDASGDPPRVLAVCHSNGAADVLLAALRDLGVPAIRGGRPAAVSPGARPSTATALAEAHPAVAALRATERNASLGAFAREAAARDARRCADEVRDALTRHARVVVASCVGANALRDAGGGAFSLVVVDEAAQTTEPAVVCALAAAGADQVVFVGDTRQLPPTVVTGDRDLRRQLATSPMERLERAGVPVATLEIQYRMPPALLEYPSAYFYGGLVRCADGPKTRRAPPAGFAWPGGAPLAFLDTSADGWPEARHGAGAVSNAAEASLAADVVAGLLRGGDVGPGAVAVVSPYARQCEAVRAALAARGAADVRVGTVDAFQGQETDVVVFSAARSNPDGRLGFVGDPRRLNVAVTRARRGLVVVGDGATLARSRPWAALLESCRGRGCVLRAADVAEELGAAAAAAAPAAPAARPPPPAAARRGPPSEADAKIAAATQRATAKAANAARRRVLVDARDAGFLAEGRVVDCVVDRVAKAGVFVVVPTPFGDYRALLRRGDATGGDAAPTLAFLEGCFPRASPLRAEIVGVVVTPGDSALHVSTRALEASPYELADDRAALDARASKRLANQGEPRALGL